MISFLPTNTPGVSSAADEIRRFSEEISISLETSEVLGTRKSREELFAVFTNGLQENWDGYGASPICHSTYNQALRFLQALPKGCPLPEVSADPDGEIAFEWFVAPRWEFSVSFAPDGRLSFAGLFGPNTTYGTECFLDEIPEGIIYNLRRVSSHLQHQ